MSNPKDKFKLAAKKGKAHQLLLAKAKSHEVISINDDSEESDLSIGFTSSKTNNYQIPKKVSSENLAKLPTLSDEELIFFKHVQDGNMVDLEDYMKSPAFSKVYINKTDKFGFSALHHAVRRQDEEMVELFLKQDSILTYDTLFHAIQEENIPITKMLMEYQDKHIQTSSTSKATVGLPTTLSPTNITSPKLLEDLAGFDSEFPTYFTPLLLSSKVGNFTLMSMFYERGERLESLEEHHNCGCPCKICIRTDTLLISANQRIYLFDAITNPNYICFIAGKNRGIDPANYAVEKIKKCRELRIIEHMFEFKRYEDFEERLTIFLKDIIELCRSNEETETFFSVPDSMTQGRLKGKYPRMWTFVELDLVPVVAHSHSQYIANKLWATSHWPEYSTYSIIMKFTQILFRIPFLPFFAMFMWLGVGRRDTWGRRLATPAGKYMNWVASYVIFLGVLSAQVILPQRCNNLKNKAPYTTLEKDCNERGAPNIGTEWVLVLYNLGFFVSMLKRNAIPWWWSSFWTWYEVLNQLLFVATFTCWLWAWIADHPPIEDRKQWGQYYPEVLADIFLSLACIMSFGRLFRLLQLSRLIGPLQLALGRMMKNFLFAVLVYFTVILGFATGFNAIYVPYNGMEGFDMDNVKSVQSSPFGEVFNAPKELFWSFYGLSGKDKTHILKFAGKASLTTVHMHHPDFSERVGKLLFGIYHIVGIVMMFNMLVAYFSQGADSIIQNADAEWKFARTQVYLTYMKDTVLPPPFNLIPTLKGTIRFFHYIGLICFGEEEHETASCSFNQCCFIKEPINKRDEYEQRTKYRKLVLELLHRFKTREIERADKTPATSDDVKEIGEELAELKSQILTKMREMQKQVKVSQTSLEESGGDRILKDKTTMSIFRGVLPSSEESSVGEGGSQIKSIHSNIVMTPSPKAQRFPPPLPSTSGKSKKIPLPPIIQPSRSSLNMPPPIPRTPTLKKPSPKNIPAPPTLPGKASPTKISISAPPPLSGKAPTTKISIPAPPPLSGKAPTTKISIPAPPPLSGKAPTTKISIPAPPPLSGKAPTTKISISAPPSKKLSPQEKVQLPFVDIEEGTQTSEQSSFADEPHIQAPPPPPPPPMPIAPGESATEMDPPIKPNK